MTIRNSLLTVLGSVMLLGAALPAHSENVLRIGLGADPDMLDPHLARTYYGRFVFASLCDRLVDVDENLKVVPGLAKDWAWSDDGKTLTLNLREGVTFHDGEKFDAAAAKYNLDRALTLKGSLRKSEISSVESVEVTGPMQIALHLIDPIAEHRRIHPLRREEQRIIPQVLHAVPRHAAHAAYALLEGKNRRARAGRG